MFRNGENVDGALLKSLLRMLTDLQVNIIVSYILNYYNLFCIMNQLLSF